jgi:hypothetical protein
MRGYFKQNSCTTKKSQQLSKRASHQTKRKFHGNSSNAQIVNLTNNWSWPATAKPVSRITSCATTNGSMVDDTTFTVWCTGPKTRINTFLVDTSRI